VGVDAAFKVVHSIEFVLQGRDRTWLLSQGGYRV
jgi:hypothetical protein